MQGQWHLPSHDWTKIDFSLSNNGLTEYKSMQGGVWMQRPSKSLQQPKWQQPNYSRVASMLVHLSVFLTTLNSIWMRVILRQAILIKVYCWCIIGEVHVIGIILFVLDDIGWGLHQKHYSLIVCLCCLISFWWICNGRLGIPGWHGPFAGEKGAVGRGCGIRAKQIFWVAIGLLHLSAVGVVSSRLSEWSSW